MEPNVTYRTKNCLCTTPLTYVKGVKGHIWPYLWSLLRRAKGHFSLIWVKCDTVTFDSNQKWSKVLSTIASACIKGTFAHLWLASKLYNLLFYILNGLECCEIPIINPGIIFIQRLFSWAYFRGSLFSEGLHYWKEFCVSKWLGLGNKKKKKKQTD